MIKFISGYDVIVVGGGTAGIIAALASGQEGVKTLLIERYGFLGGNITAGEVYQLMTFFDSDGVQVLKGVSQRLIDGLMEINGTVGHVVEQQGLLFKTCAVDPEALKYLVPIMMEHAKVDILLHSFTADVLMNKNAVRGVVVENKSGRTMISAHAVIDCTGDADVAAFAGAEYEIAKNQDLQPMSLIFRMGNVEINHLFDYVKSHPEEFKIAEDVDLEHIKETPFFINTLEFFPPWRNAIKEGKLPKEVAVQQCWIHTSGANIKRNEVNVNITRAECVDGTDAWALSSAEIACRKQVPEIVRFLKENVPGFENAFLFDTAPQIGVRETRRVIGEYVLNEKDVSQGRTFPDGIARSGAPIDIHESVGEKQYLWKKTSKRGSVAYEIPYRCLVPKEVDGLLIAGRCISATHTAQGSTRLAGTCMATGEAAGVAAALAVKSRTEPRSVDVKELRCILQGRTL